MKNLIIMCGVPGAGKDTWINKNKDKFKGEVSVVSRDDIRFSLVDESEDYFSREKEVFSLFIKNIKDRLDDSDIVIANATHINTKSRAKLMRNLGSSLKGVKVSVLYLKVPLSTVVERNDCRTGRKLVPYSALCNMYSSFEKPELYEGFDEIITYDGENFTIERN